MNDDINPYEPPQNSYEPPQAPSASPTIEDRGLIRFCICAAVILLFAAMLGPADDGRLGRYWTVCLTLFDTIVYFAFFSGRRTRFNFLGGVLLIMGSIVTVVATTYLVDLLRLP